MKRGTPNHPKLKKLGRLLGLPPYAAIGICEALWHHAAAYAPRGDIGRWQDDEIAEAIGWPVEDAKKLVSALVESGLFDQHDEFRLVVHHWSEHADDGVQKAVARARQTFADGTPPKMSRLTKAEREEIEADMRRQMHAERTPDAQRTPNGRPETHAERSPSGLPLPIANCHSHSHRPLPIAKGKRASAFSKLKPEDISDPRKLLAWYEEATQRKKPVIAPSEENRIRAFAAAAYALRIDHEGTPQWLFASVVSEGHWDWLTNDDRDKGNANLKHALNERNGRSPDAHSRRGPAERSAMPESIGSVMSVLLPDGGGAHSSADESGGARAQDAESSASACSATTYDDLGGRA